MSQSNVGKLELLTVNNGALMLVDFQPSMSVAGGCGALDFWMRWSPSGYMTGTAPKQAILSKKFTRNKAQ